MVKNLIKTVPSQNKNSGQTTLEFSLCFLILAIIFIAGFLVFKWGGQSITYLQLNYQATRGSPNPPVDFYTPPDMDLTINIAQ